MNALYNLHVWRFYLKLDRYGFVGLIRMCLIFHFRWPILLHYSNHCWKTSLHCDEEPYNIEFCANLGHYNSQPPQHITWFVRRQSSACRAKTCERMLRHRAVYSNNCAAVCILPRPPRKHYLGQGWRNYLLSRTAWIVHYRWWAAKSIDFILKFCLYLTMRKAGLFWITI